MLCWIIWLVDEFFWFFLCVLLIFFGYGGIVEFDYIVSLCEVIVFVVYVILESSFLFIDCFWIEFEVGLLFVFVCVVCEGC